MYLWANFSDELLCGFALHIIVGFWIMFLCSMLFHYKVGKKKHWFPTRATECYLHVFSMWPWLFCGYCGLHPHPEDVHVRWICVSPLSLSKWGSVWVHIGMEGRHAQGFHLGPWGSSIGSRLWSWTGISKLESHYLMCFYQSFLTVCIAYVRFNV